MCPAVGEFAAVLNHVKGLVARGRQQQTQEQEGSCEQLKHHQNF